MCVDIDHEVVTDDLIIMMTLLGLMFDVDNYDDTNIRGV